MKPCFPSFANLVSLGAHTILAVIKKPATLHGNIRTATLSLNEVSVFQVMRGDDDLVVFLFYKTTNNVKKSSRMNEIVVLQRIIEQ